MPSNWLYVDTNFPSFTGKESVNDKINVIQSYLYVLLENLRYSLRNLDASNMNQTALREYTNGITEPIYGRLEDADGNINQLQVTAQGLAASMKDAQGNITSLQATARGLSAQISNAEGNITNLQATAQGLSARITNAEGSVTTLQATADRLATRVSGAEGAVSAITQNMKNITLSVENEDSYSVISLSGEGITAQSKTISFKGMVTFSSLAKPTTTKIYGGNIDTSTLRVDNLYGTYVHLRDSGGNSQGYFSITGANTAGYAVDLTSYGALRMTANSGDVYIQSGSYYGPHLRLSSLDGVVLGGGNTRPNNSIYSCGTSDSPWSDIYSFNSTIQTSDRNKKHDIEPLPEKYLDMLGRIEPRRFKLNDGSSGRYHVGFIAQEVEDAMAAAGVDPLEFGGWVKDKDEDGNDIYMLRYSEFIAVLWGKLRQLEEHIKKLEGLA